jgi:hypothetical protein
MLRYFKRTALVFLATVGAGLLVSYLLTAPAEAAKDCAVPAEWGDAVSITHVDRGPSGWFVILFQAEDGTVRALGADRDCRGKASMLELPRR